MQLAYSDSLGPLLRNHVVKAGTKNHWNIRSHLRLGEHRNHFQTNTSVQPWADKPQQSFPHPIHFEYVWDTLVVLDDSMNNRQSQSAAFTDRFGREVGIEYDGFEPGSIITIPVLASMDWRIPLRKGNFLMSIFLT